MFVASWDTGTAIYNRYHGHNNVGYAAHFGGALCGENLWNCGDIF